VVCWHSSKRNDTVPKPLLSARQPPRGSDKARGGGGRQATIGTRHFMHRRSLDGAGPASQPRCHSPGATSRRHQPIASRPHVRARTSRHATPEGVGSIDRRRRLRPWRLIRTLFARRIPLVPVPNKTLRISTRPVDMAIAPWTVHPRPSKVSLANKSSGQCLVGDLGRFFEGSSLPPSPRSVHLQVGDLATVL